MGSAFLHKHFNINVLLADGFMNKENNKEAEIKESFHKTLSMYPIKNLEDLYDKEGYRDEEFEKRDKGTWIINSVMNIQKRSSDGI